MMRSLLILCFIFGLFYISCYAEIQFGDNPLYDAVLYPANVNLKDGSTVQGHLDLYPYREQHTYRTQPLTQGSDVLSLLKDNYPNQPTLGIYTQLLEIEGTWVAKESAIRLIPWKQISSVALETSFNETNHFSNDNNPALVHLNQGAMLGDREYELLRDKVYAKMTVPDSMGDTVLFSTNSQVQQIDLFILGALMALDYDVSGYDCHPYLNRETAYDLDNIILYSLWDYSEEAYNEVRQSLVNCRQSWMDVAAKLADNPYILPEMQAVCMSRMYNLASLCDTHLAELDGFYANRTQLPHSAQHLFTQFLGECVFPSVTFPAKEDVDWKSVLQTQGIVTVFLQAD